MENHPRISELLVKTGAFTDLNKPVILTSGELGIYYVNTEKLLQDEGEWKQHGKDPQAMIKHAISRARESSFGEVIDILAEKVGELVRQSSGFNDYTISGGQRRDWIFSGPVADKLQLAHLSIYKDGRVGLIPPREGRPGKSPSLEGALNFHISDLLTEASSCYRQEDGQEYGWIPAIRKETKAQMTDLIAVVTRLQGGEERLEKIGIIAHPFVAIDQDFAKQHSKSPERALAYMQNPTKWSENYLRENGALSLVETFNPKGRKLDRAVVSAINVLSLFIFNHLIFN